MMLGQNLQICFTQEQKMEITSEMSACDSVFPVVESWIRTTSDHQKAIEFVAKRKKMDRYISVVDFLVGEVFGGDIKRACFRYYKDKGPKLREQITDEARQKMELVLIFVLVRAYKVFKAHREMSWKNFVIESKSMLLAAQITGEPI